jgi:hypothetical protein
MAAQNAFQLLKALAWPADPDARCSHWRLAAGDRATARRSGSLCSSWSARHRAARLTGTTSIPVADTETQRLRERGHLTEFAHLFRWF